MEKIMFEGLAPEAAEYIDRQNKYISELEAANKKFQDDISRLDENLSKLRKMIFGQSSEKSKYILPDGVSQLTIPLFNEAEAIAACEVPEAAIVVPEHKRKAKRTKEQLAQTLPVVEEIIDIAEDERKCGICEGEIALVGKELVRQTVEIIPARAYLKKLYRNVYRCPDCANESDEENFVKPMAPEPVIKRGLLGASAIAHVVYEKFVNAMPFARQESGWKNFGLEVSRATLANEAIYVAEHWLIALWLYMKVILLKEIVIHADETVVQVLKEDGKKASSDSRMWVYCSGDTGNPRIVLFEYQPSRNGDHAKAFLEGFEGYLQTDGCPSYNKVPNVTHCGCWAHLRRRFNDALPKTGNKAGKAAEGLEFCRQLFALEKSFAELGYDERLKMRLERSKPVLEAFFVWVSDIRPLKESKLGDAVTYALNQKQALSAFLLDGRVEISNNRVENAIRPFTVGRKNWLFSDTVNGAKSSAVCYSIVETAKANGLNPYLYLKYIFSKLPTAMRIDPSTDLAQFMPWSQSVKAYCLFDCDEDGQFNLLAP